MRAQNVTREAEEEEVVGQVQSFPPFESWVERMNEEPEFLVDEVVVQRVSSFSSTDAARLGIVKLHTQLINEKGLTIPSSFILKGGSAVCLIIFESNGTNYAVITHKLRLSVGTEISELPGGFVDSLGNFRGTSISLLNALIPSIQIDLHTLVDLTEVVYTGSSHPRVFTVPQGSDEGVRIMLYRQKVSQKVLLSLKEALKAAHEDSTQTMYFEILPLNDVLEAMDARTVAAAYMLAKVLEEGGNIFTAEAIS